MYGLAGAEVETFAGNFHLLPLQAGKVHFDAVALTVVESVMLESVEIEEVPRSSRLMRVSRLRLNLAVTPALSL